MDDPATINEMFLKSINLQPNGVSHLRISYLLKPFAPSLFRNFKNLCFSIRQNWITRSPLGFATQCSSIWKICSRSSAGISLFLFLRWNLSLRKSFPAATIHKFMVADDTDQFRLNPFQFLTQTTVVPLSLYVNLCLFALSWSTTFKMIFLLFFLSAHFFAEKIPCLFICVGRVFSITLGTSLIAADLIGFLFRICATRSSISPSERAARILKN